MKPRFYRPHGALTRFVKYFWTFEWGERDTVRTLSMFATGVSGILLQHYDGRPALGSTVSARPVSRGGCPTAFVYGKRTHPAQTFSNGPFRLMGAVFRPQGLHMLLNTDPVALNDRSAGLGEFSREQLGDQLLNAKDDQERVARLSKFLRARVDGARAEDLLVTQTLQLIRRDTWSIRVPQLLKRLHVSERHLERRFVRAMGVSPHQYIRILRFREALHLMKAGQFDRLSDVAYDLNYVDQSHFIKDTKALSGYTPKQLVTMVDAGVDLPCALIETPRDSYVAATARRHELTIATGNDRATRI